MSYLGPFLRVLGVLLALIGAYIGIAALGLLYYDVQGNWIRWLIPLTQMIIFAAFVVVASWLLRLIERPIQKCEH